MSGRTRRELSDLAITLCIGCRLANAQQRYELGIMVGKESRVLFQELEDKQGSAEASLALAIAYHARMVHAEARPLAEESLELFRLLDDQRGIARTLSLMASIVSYYQQHRRALALAEESLALWRGLGEHWEIADQLHQIAEFALHLNEYTHAEQRAEEGLALARKVEHHRVCAYTLYALARVEQHRHGESVARPWFEESLAMHRALGNVDGIALILCDLAHQAWLQKKLEMAQELCEQSIVLFLKRMNRPGLINSLGQLSSIVVLNGKHRWGVRLLATSDMVRETIGLAPTPLKVAYRRIALRTLTPLAWQEFVRAWREGREMTPEEVFKQRDEFSFEKIRWANRQHRLEQGQTCLLTDREQEVLSWLAQGLTNRQIAERLVISTVTVNAHVRSIYTKINVSSRSAATRYAFESKLL